MTKLLHPRLLGLLLIFLFATQSNYAQVIHCWDFNSPTGVTGDQYPSPTGSEVDINNRVTGDGSITHNFAPATTQSFGGSSQNLCSGSTDGQAFVVRGGASLINNGRHIDFNFSTEGYENLNLSFWTSRSNSGFTTNQIKYSIDNGNTFSNYPSGSYFATASGVVRSFSVPSFNQDLNDKPNLIIRIVFNGATNANGNNYIDNLKLEGTPIINNDDDSVVVLDPTEQIQAKTIVAADITSPSQAESIFSFDIQDSGFSDGFATKVTQMQFLATGNNTANLSSTINDFILKDGSNNIVPGTFNIAGIEILFNPDIPFSVADGASENFTLEAVLNASGIIDGSIIQLSIAEVDANFQADSSGSQFASSFPSGIIGNEIIIDIVASKIEFLQQPTDTNLNDVMQPAVEVGFVDDGGNLDTDIDNTSSVALSSLNGDLDGQPVTALADAGVATFNNLTHSTTATGLTMEAVSGSFTAESDAYTIAQNDLTSEVVEPGTQVGPGTIEAVDGSANPQEVFRFDISDLGGDGQPTEVNQMRFVATASNTLDWSADLQQVIVNDFVTGDAIPGSYTVAADEIIFTPDDPFVVGDLSTASFSVDILLNTTGIVDQSVIQFQVEGTNSGFTAELSGSLFNSTFTNGSVTGEPFTIDVKATELAFLQQPTDVEVGDNFVPTVQVGFVDANGNLDTSKTSDVDMASSGGNSNLPFTVSAVGGIASFPTIAFTAEATGLILTATTTDANLTTQTVDSNSFNVQNSIIAIQDFDGTTPEWTYGTSISTFNNSWGTSYFDEIDIATANPELSSTSFVNDIFGVNNLNSVNAGPASLDFATVNVSGFTGVNLSFDWEVNGYDTTSDVIQYEVIIDGDTNNANLVTVFTGSATSVGSGTANFAVTDGTQTVELRIIVQDSGSDDYFGVDNVKLTGNTNAGDTDIVAPGTQIESGILVADEDNEVGQAVEVFSFEVVDSGNFDNLPTTITQLRFIPGSGNTVDWGNNIGGISISDGTNSLLQANQSVTITSNEIILEINGNPGNMFEVADGGSKVYTLSVFLNSNPITDQEILKFAIDSGNQGQLAVSAGSTFSSSITTFEGNPFTIDVVGRQLEFLVQPTTTAVNVNMSPSVQVANTDSNGNIDLDNVGQVLNITSSGTLSVSPITKLFGASGIASFNTINHTQPGFDIKLTAASGSFTGVESSPFDILPLKTLLISEVVDPSDDPDGRYVELFNMDVEPLELSVLNHYLHNETAGLNVQLTGTIPAKSYYVISFVDAVTFNTIYGRDPDFVAPANLASDGQDVYYLSFEGTEQSLVDIHGILGETGTTGTSWEYPDARYARDIPTVWESNSTYTSGEWILKDPASTTDATIGIGDNDFIYDGNWSNRGIGNSPGNFNGGANLGRSIFVENGEATLSSSNLISDVIVRANATLIVQDELTLNGDFANFGKVIFKSTDTKTAVLGEFDALNRKLVGTNYEIERHIPKSNRAFRYLSPSVNTSSNTNPSLYPKPTIRDNWQEGENNTNTSTNLNPNPGYGTHITGDKNGDNGFDATLTGNPSMFQWNTSSVSWDAIPNTDTKTFNAGEAYAILIRGDRNTTLNSNTAVGDPTTLRTTGRMFIGSKGVQNVSSTGDGFTLIGNPYQAKVNLTNLLDNSSGVNSNFAWIYDPTLGSKGGYATVDLTNGSNTSTVPGDSDATNILEPNQAFFAQTVSSPVAAPAVVFQESLKASGTGGNVAFNIPKQTTNLNVNLYYDDLQTKTVDAVRVKFRSGANNAKDTLDATKVWNYDESFAIDRNPNYMAIETRAMPTEQDSIPFYLGNFTRTAYRLEIQPEHFSGAEVLLYDRYLETTTEIPTDMTTSVSFEIDNAIPASKAPDRFVVKFGEVSLSDDDFTIDRSFTVYPNPVKGQRFSISHQQAFEGQDLDVKLFDLQGRQVFDQKIDNAPRVEVNFDKNLSSGVYILKLSDGKTSQSVKLIIE